jgi:hypothetical protein
MSPAEIKAARKAMGLSTAGMAEWLGLELPNGEKLIRDWEHGRRDITGPAAKAIELALGPANFSSCFVGPEPIAMKAGDERVLVNGRPLRNDFRIVSEGNYRRIMEIVARSGAMIDEEIPG